MALQSRNSMARRVRSAAPRALAVAAAVAATAIAAVVVAPEEPAAGLVLIALAWIPVLVLRTRREQRAEPHPALTLVDPETGLGTAELLDEILRREIARSDRYDVPLSLAVFEIEIAGFRPSAPGDLPPSPAPFVARALVNSARESDSVFRLDRRRFVVVLPESDSRGRNALVTRALKQIGSTPYARNPDGTGVYARALGTAVRWVSELTTPGQFIAAGLEALSAYPREDSAQAEWHADEPSHPGQLRPGSAQQG